MSNVLRRLKSAGLDRVGFRVVVEERIESAPDFQLITLRGASIIRQAWRPGDKLKLQAPGAQVRAYTPFDWDPTAGRARILSAGLGAGPGTTYLAQLQAGDSVHVVKRSRSINLDLDSAPIIVGDETVIALAAAWASCNPDQPATVLLEAANLDHCNQAAASVGVAADRVTDYGSLPSLVVEAAGSRPSAPLVISGRAQHIRSIREALKAHGLHQRPTQSQAYWDENRSGLD